MASKSIVSKIDLPIDLAHLGTYTQGDSWWKGAHSLKGVALGVGAGELAALAERAEAHGNSSAAVRGDEIAAIQAALERVRCFVADLT